MEAPVNSVRLFVNSQRKLCLPLETVLTEWALGRDDVVTSVIPVLKDPLETVRLQIFVTPALVVNDEVIGMNIVSAEILKSLLNTIVCPKSDSGASN